MFSICYIHACILFLGVILKNVKLLLRAFFNMLSVSVKISISVSVPREIQSLNLPSTNIIRR